MASCPRASLGSSHAPHPDAGGLASWGPSDAEVRPAGRGTVSHQGPMHSVSGNHGVEAARPLTVTSHNLAEDPFLPSWPRGIHRTGGPRPQSSRERGLFLHVKQRLPLAAGLLLLPDQRLEKGASVPARGSVLIARGTWGGREPHVRDPGTWGPHDSLPGGGKGP